MLPLTLTQFQLGDQIQQNEITGIRTAYAICRIFLRKCSNITWVARSVQFARGLRPWSKKKKKAT
jgi:hypothetical protein